MALLSERSNRVDEILVLRSRHDHRIQKIISLAKKLLVPVSDISDKDFIELVGEVNHQGVIARTRKLEAPSFAENDIEELLSNLSKPALLLILDGIQDPHNLGACLRSADASGVNLVITPKDKSAGLTPVVKKVASGAAESVPFIQVTNLSRTILDLQKMGIWLIGATEEAEKTIFEMELQGPVAIVLGAEGSGLRKLTKERCDFLCKIPMAGKVSSLNVSVAAGVCLFEAVRQRFL